MKTKIRMRISYGVMNYSIGGLLLALPFLHTAEQSMAAHIVPSFTGAFVLVASVFTNYELGLLRLLSFRENLLTVIALGGFLFISPFLFNFYTQGFVIHVITGSLLSISAWLIYKTIFVNRHRNVLNARA